MPEKSTTPDPGEIVRRQIEAGNRRDAEGMAATFTRDAVWDMSSVGIGVYEGREAIRGFFEDWLAAYENLEGSVTEHRDLTNRVSFTAFVQRGRPRGTGALLEIRYAAVNTWADGVIERATNYTDIDEARAAAERLAGERG